MLSAYRRKTIGESAALGGRAKMQAWKPPLCYTTVEKLFFFIFSMRNFIASGVLFAILLAPVGALAAEPQPVYYKTCTDGSLVKASNTGYIYGFVQNWLCIYDRAWTIPEISKEKPELVR